jgi:hypothetical protein
MWEKLTPDDIERARQRLTDRRAEIEQELRGLDDQWREIATLEQLIGAFARIYMSSPTEPMAPERAEPQLIAATDNGPPPPGSLPPATALAPDLTEPADLAPETAEWAAARAPAGVNANRAETETGGLSALVVTALTGSAENAELRQRAQNIAQSQRAAGD